MASTRRRGGGGIGGRPLGRSPASRPWPGASPEELEGGVAPPDPARPDRVASGAFDADYPGDADYFGTATADADAPDDPGDPSGGGADDAAGRSPADVEVELQRVSYDQPRWITSDALLRDEGVAYGMGMRGAGGLDDDAIAAKLDAIAGYYHVRERVVAERVEQLGRKVERTRERLAERADEERSARAAIEALTADAHDGASAAADGSYGRVVALALAGTVVSLGFLGFLVWWYSGVFGRPVAALIALATWLLGQATTDPTNSYLLGRDADDEETERREQWKQLIEDLGFPLVASLLTLTLTSPHHDVLWSFSVLLVSLLFFTFVGRAVLKQLLELPRLFARQRRRRAAAVLRERDRQRLETRAYRAAHQSRRVLPRRIDALLEERDALALRLVAVAAERERKQALFLSEFRLTVRNPSFLNADN